MHTPKSTRKKEGFQGQKAIVIPRKILSDKCAKNMIAGAMYITDMGYYPKAKFHYRERPAGADQHIIIYCMEGNGRAVINKREYRIEPGEFIFIPSKTAHLYEADADNPWTIYWTHFKGMNAEAVIKQLEKNFAGHKGFLKHNENTVGLFNEMYNQLERGYSTDNLIYSSMCLWHYLTAFMFNNKYSAPGKLSYKDPTDVAIDFLQDRIGSLLTLEEIAAAVNLSASHFSFLFKNKTGFSPIEYFNHLKIQRACQYLLFTNLRIREISWNLGIEDPYYFSRLFKKVMGVAPGEYRVKRVH
ncbi:MAG: AraC family transcriptional regulator [Chitinophagaceae bacterium]|nr:AraC family transcriptional regulator [Chitinophagaceae bacterium]